LPEATDPKRLLAASIGEEDLQRKYEPVMRHQFQPYW